MTKEQLKEKIAKRIEWLESQKDEITVEYCKDEIPFEMYDTGITECNGGICELEMILESI